MRPATSPSASPATPVDISATMDAAGRVVLPRAIRVALGLRAGMRLQLHVRAGRLEATVAEDDAPLARAASGRRVLGGASAPSDARAAVRAEREARASGRRGR